METVSKYFPLLFSPYDLGPIRVPNRIVSSGHDTVLARDGKVTDELIAYHEERARGGTGLIVVQVAGVHETARYTSHMLMATDDSCIEGYRSLAAKVHAHGTKVFGQLFHPGREVLDLDNGTRRVCVAPSSVPNERGRVTPRALTLLEISSVIAGYASAARRLVLAQLDGVEIVASHGYLPSQFLNPVTNQREDTYGGSEENRRRFLLEVLRAVRGEVPNAAVGLRISLDERDSAGLSIDEALAVIKLVSNEKLIDYVSVTTGTSATLAGSDHIAPDMTFSAGYVAPGARRVRTVTDLPVMLAGRFNQPQEAERFLADNSADAIVMTRALICDPTMPALARAGQLDDIRACVGCNQACIGRFQLGVPISCIQHPETGRELLFPTVRKDQTGKRAVVIGAGPAGQKAAAVLAAHGVHVDLYERNSIPGGQVRLAGLLPGREEFAGVTANLSREMQRHGVTLHLSREMTAEQVAGLGANFVVVATGSEAYVPPVEVMGSPVVATSDQVLEGFMFAPGHVVVADVAADWVGAALAQLLRARNHRVTLVTTATLPGESLQQYVRDEQLRSLSSSGVEVMTLTRLFGLDDDTAYLEHVLTGGRTLLAPLAGVVCSGWRRPVSSLLTSLEKQGVPAVGVGDCLAPRTVEEAVLEGLRAATAFCSPST
jgi:2,4-dienoyl-CoA reductase-like NADH-dependent reductase (Old Yellow Enzyme family)